MLMLMALISVLTNITISSVSLRGFKMSIFAIFNCDISSFFIVNVYFCSELAGITNKAPFSNVGVNDSGLASFD